MTTEEQQPPIEVPFTELPEDTLSAIIESFILREGTDYGINEVEKETKVKQVLKQIHHGDVKVIFDPGTESITLMTKKDWEKAAPLIKKGMRVEF